MAEETASSDPYAETRERMARIQQGIRAGVDAKLAEILARYGVSAEDAAAAADELYSAYEKISRDVHKDVMGK